MNSWVNNREAGDFRRLGADYDVIVMNYDFASVTAIVGKGRYSELCYQEGSDAHICYGNAFRIDVMVMV